MSARAQTKIVKLHRLNLKVGVKPHIYILQIRRGKSSFEFDTLNPCLVNFSCKFEAVRISLYYTMGACDKHEESILQS